MAAHRVARRHPHPRIALVGIVAAVATMTGCYSGQPVDQLLTGDEELLAVLREQYPQARDRVALAVIDGAGERTAFVSADASTGFGLGSATRALTGLLLADAVERGEVSLEDPVGAYLDLGDAPAGALSLGDLATHHSGLPQSPLGPGAYEPDVAADAGPVDRGGIDALLARVAVLDLVPELEYNPSDFDAALIGQSLAAATGVRFADLLAERVLAPAGMEHAVVVESGDLVPDGLAQGHDRRGERAAARGTGAYAPAVGVTVTIDDGVALARAVLEGPFAHSAALEPIARTRWPQVEIGYFWEQLTSDGGDVVYVVGSAEGFTGAVLADQRAGRAAVLLSNGEEAWPWSRLRPLLQLLGE
ncbi:serine hydrolase domain-containing protein [Agromyces sp. GXS1127]|uniref:serine hydrolase domain-containing protein n=1 Tax=Agromyces sp. GXS1127 TaxID=3424181 RepID=UPI003D318FC4